MVDRVQVIKWESPSGGGTQEDMEPAAINPNEDAVEARGYLIQNDTSSDNDVEVSRDASGNMIFKDKVVSGTKTLADLLAGGAAFDVNTILTDDITGSVVVDDITGNVLVDS